MPELVLSRGGDELLRIAIDGPRLVLGRGPGADVALPDKTLAPTQYALRKRGSALVLEDLSGGSPDRALEDGAMFALGDYRARVAAHGWSAGSRATATDPLASEDAPAGALVLRNRRSPQSSRRVDGPTFTIGGGAGNTLVLDDKAVSGRHCRIVREGLGWAVEDLGSRNGTFLDGVKVRHAALAPGAVLRLGGSELVVESAVATDPRSVPGMVATDPAMRAITDWIHRVAASEAPVAVEGESGTGKEVVARAVHQLSRRREAAFVPVNCGAIAQSLWESELFGHERGAFTGAAGTRPGAFEEADKGTLFLDEVGELPPEAQAKLLRALELGEVKRVGASRAIHVDVRIIAATNKDLRREVEERRFREDLFYRLYVLPVALPPLRLRPADVLPLAEHFLLRLSPAGARRSFTRAARERLATHAWPGNARELRNVVQRALCLAHGESLGEETLIFDPPRPSAAPPAEGPRTLLEIERQAIENALARHGRNRTAAAKELGLSRATMSRKVAELKIGN